MDDRALSCCRQELQEYAAANKFHSLQTVNVVVGAKERLEGPVPTVRRQDAERDGYSLFMDDRARSPSADLSL